MLRYRYENSFDMSLSNCIDCDNTDCPYPNSKNSSVMQSCMYFRGQYKHPEVTNRNAEWLLFQIARDVQMSILVVKTNIRNHMMNWQKPEGLKDNDLERNSNIHECYLYVDVLREYLHFLQEKKKEYEKMKRDPTAATMAFVYPMMFTRIIIENDLVKLYTTDTELIERLRNITLKNKAKFEVIYKHKKLEKECEQSVRN